jgi:hypothetical protein
MRILSSRGLDFPAYRLSAAALFGTRDASDHWTVYPQPILEPVK